MALAAEVVAALKELSAEDKAEVVKELGGDAKIADLMQTVEKLSNRLVALEKGPKKGSLLDALLGAKKK